MKAESYLTVFGQLRAGININIYAQTSWLRSILQQKNTRVEWDFTLFAESNLTSWMKHNLTVKHQKPSHVVMTMPRELIACWCGFTVLKWVFHCEKNRTNTSVRHIQGWTQWYWNLLRKENMNSVYSPLRCERSLRKTWQHHPWNKNWARRGMGNNNDDGKWKTKNFSLRLLSLWRKQLLPYSLSPRNIAKPFSS